jgi:photosystem II oxygen-evolving enhancer protein 3
MAQAMSSMAALRGVSQSAVLESGHMMSSTRPMPTTAPARLAPAGIKPWVLSVRAASEDSSSSTSSSSSAQSTRRSILGLFAAGVTVGAVAQKALADARSIKLDGPPPPSGGKPGTLLSDEARDLDLPLKERFYIQPLSVEQAAARAKESAKEILEVKKLIDKKAWPYVQNDLRSKASYLRYDLNTVISSKPKDQKKPLKTLTSKLFDTLDNLDYAARSKDAPKAEKYYAETVSALNDVISKLG